MLKRISLKQYDKNELYSFSLTTKSGRQDPDGMKILQTAWLIICPLFLLGNRAFSNDFMDMLPIPLIIVNSLSIGLLLSSIYILFFFDRMTVKLEVFQAFIFSMQTVLLGVMILNFGIIFYFSDFLENNGISHFRKTYSSEAIFAFFNDINLIVPIVIVSTYLYLVTIIRKKETRKESLKSNKVERNEGQVGYIYPAAVSILIPVIAFVSMLRTSNLQWVLNISTLVYFFGGCLIIVFGVNNYMIYYIKKRFPEEYAVSYQKKAGDET